MAIKNFDDLIKTLLTKKELADIAKQARLETKIFKAWQKSITQTISDYMKKNNAGFNDLVRILNISPTQVAKLQKGEANLTLATMAHVFTSLNQEPQLVFKKNK